MTDRDPFDLLRTHIDAQFASVHRRIDDRHDEVMRRMDETDEVLHGNGQPGLIRLVDRHEQQLKKENKTAAKHGGAWGAAVSAVVSGVVIGVAAVFGLDK